MWLPGADIRSNFPEVQTPPEAGTLCSNMPAGGIPGENLVKPTRCTHVRHDIQKWQMQLGRHCGDGQHPRLSH